MVNPEKLPTLGTQDEDKQDTRTPQHNKCWTPLYTQANTNNVNTT